MDLLGWLMEKSGIDAGLTMEFFAGRGVINKNTAEVQIELVQKAIDSLVPGYEMKSLAWMPSGKKSGTIGPFDRVGWNKQRKGISRGQYRKHAAVAWRGEDQQDFFLMATERTAVADSIRISTSLAYAAALCAEPERVEKLVGIAREAWGHLKLRYAYANLGMTDEGSSFPRAQATIADWSTSSAITLADVSPTVDEAVASEFATKVKGAFWFNVFNPAHVKAMGGADVIDQAFPQDLGIRIEEFKNGGLLLQLDDTPALEVTNENEAKFSHLRQLVEPILAK